MIKEDLSAELKIVLGYLTLKEPYDNAFNTPEDAIKKMQHICERKPKEIPNALDVCLEAQDYPESPKSWYGFLRYALDSRPDQTDKIISVIDYLKSSYGEERCFEGILKTAMSKHPELAPKALDVMFSQTMNYPRGSELKKLFGKISLMADETPELTSAFLDMYSKALSSTLQNLNEEDERCAKWMVYLYSKKDPDKKTNKDTQVFLHDSEARIRDLLQGLHAGFDILNDMVISHPKISAPVWTMLKSLHEKDKSMPLWRADKALLSISIFHPELTDDIKQRIDSEMMKVHNPDFFQELAKKTKRSGIAPSLLPDTGRKI